MLNTVPVHYNFNDAKFRVSAAMAMLRPTPKAAGRLR